MTGHEINIKVGNRKKVEIAGLNTRPYGRVCEFCPRSVEEEGQGADGKIKGGISMKQRNHDDMDRRRFLKKTGAASLAAGAAVLGGAALAGAQEKKGDVVLRDYWAKRSRGRRGRPLTGRPNTFTVERTLQTIPPPSMPLLWRSVPICPSFSPSSPRGRRVSTSSTP